MTEKVKEWYKEAIENFQEGDTRLYIKHFLFYTNIKVKDIYESRYKYEEMFNEVIIHTKAYDIEGRELEGYKSVYVFDCSQSREIIESITGKQIKTNSKKELELEIPVIIKLPMLSTYNSINKLIVGYAGIRFPNVEVRINEKDYNESKNLIINLLFPRDVTFESGEAILHDLDDFLCKHVDRLDVDKVTIIPFKKGIQSE